MTCSKFSLLLPILMLLGCQSPRPGPPPATASAGAPDLRATYAQLGQVGGQVFALDPSASTVRAYVFRAGRAAQLGHNHVLSAPRFTGFVHLPAQGIAGARFDLEFRLDQLEVDRPEYRSALGPAFTTPLPPEAIAATRDHMLGSEGMQANQFPTLRVQALEIMGEAPKCAAKIRVGLHGQTQDMWIPLEVAGLPERLAVTGAVVLRQSDFGVRPYSVLNGLLAIRDEVVVEFSLRGRPLTSSPPS